MCVIVRLLALVVLCQRLLLLAPLVLSDDRREGLIQEAVKSLLGVKDAADAKGAPNKQRTPPRYMLDLYEQYKTGKVPTQGNTVRSILPIKGKYEGVDMLVFNLTGVHPEEQILQGMLHLYKRKLRGGRKRESTSYRLKITDMKSHFEPQLLELLHRRKQGWSSYDVTDSVTRCRSLNSDNDSLLSVTAEVRKPNGRIRPVLLRRVLRLNSQPFLIIFSEDRNNKREAHDSSLEEKSNLSEQILQNMAWNTSQIDKSPYLEDILRTRIKRSPLLNTFKNHTQQPRMVSGGVFRRKFRSLPSNEVSDLMNSSSNRITHDELLKRYSKKIDPNLIPIPHGKKSKQMYLLRKKKNRRRNRKLPFWWIQHEGKHAAHNTDRICQRRKLVVDFAKIGWNEWVISPNSFEAYYCSGGCTFPLIKNGKPSNHATIQSLVRVFGNDQVPAPCCVPSSTSSLTMLYFDENESVVLKNYPNMIVKSCACR